MSHVPTCTSLQCFCQDFKQLRPLLWPVPGGDGGHAVGHGVPDLGDGLFEAEGKHGPDGGLGLGSGLGFFEFLGLTAPMGVHVLFQ